MTRIHKLIQQLKTDKTTQLDRYLQKPEQIISLLHWSSERSLELEGLLIERYTPLLETSSKGLQTLSASFHRFHRYAESYHYRYQLISQSPADAQSWLSLIQSVVGRRDHWWCVSLCKEALEHCPHHRQILEILLESLDILCHDNCEQSYKQELENYIALYQKLFEDTPAQMFIINILMKTQIEKTKDLLHSLIEKFPDAIDAQLQLASFHLYKKEISAAKNIASQYISDPDYAALANRILGACTFFEQDYPRAKQLLQTSLKYNENDAETFVWLSEVSLYQEDFKQGILYADRALSTSKRYNLLGKILRRLNTDEEREIQAKNNPVIVENSFNYRVPLFDRKEIMLEKLLLFGGNRSTNLTILQNDTLKNYLPPPDAAHVGRRIQHVLYTRGIQEALSLSNQYHRYFHSPFFNNYRGELFLWVGDYVQAEFCFREGIQKDNTTKWCWIGLGASLMYQGRETEALETWETGLSIVRFAGPTLYAYRGECHVRLGNTSEAREDLEHALAQKPTRISARIILKLMEAKQDTKLGERYIQKLWKDFPIMMLDIIGQAQLSPSQTLQKILSAMRGNRSSTMVMYMVEENLRFLPLQQIKASLN